MQTSLSGTMVSFGFNYSITLFLFVRSSILTCMSAIAWELHPYDSLTATP